VEWCYKGFVLCRVWRKTGTVLFYIDDLIRQLCVSQYGVLIARLYPGSILYADDTALLSGSCRGMLDICTEYGPIWDIQFNPDHRQMMMQR